MGSSECSVRLSVQVSPHQGQQVSLCWSEQFDVDTLFNIQKHVWLWMAFLCFYAQLKFVFSGIQINRILSFKFNQFHISNLRKAFNVKCCLIKTPFF